MFKRSFSIFTSWNTFYTVIQLASVYKRPLELKTKLFIFIIYKAVDLILFILLAHFIFCNICVLWYLHFILYFVITTTSTHLILSVWYWKQKLILKPAQSTIYIHSLQQVLCMQFQKLCWTRKLSQKLQPAKLNDHPPNTIFLERKNQ